MDITNPNFMCVADRNGVIPYGQVVMPSTWDHEHSQIDSHQTSTRFEQDF